jgi:pilus assembly protein CpaB
MDRKRLIVLAVALVAACCAALLVRGMLGGGTSRVQAKTAPEIAMSEVLVASVNLTPGQAVAADQVRWEKWPTTAVDSSFITHGAVGSVEEVIKGTVVRSPVLAGQPLVSTTLVHADASGFMAAMLTEGMRAVSINVSAETGAGGFILPNDRIDVIQARKINESVISRTILSNIRVLAVDQTFHQEKDAKTVIGKTATLEVTPEQAEILYSAQTAGTLSLSLRPLGDNQLVATAAPSRKKSVSSYDGQVAVIRYGVKTGAPAQQEKTQ